MSDTYSTIEFDPPDPSIDRFENFIKNSKYVMNLLYNRDYNPIITKRTFTEKLTKHPTEGNMEYLTDIITQNNGAKNLIIAPTGSGKTYSIDAIFKQLKSNEKQLLCLLCPNRVQNLQNESSDDYSFEALIEGVCLEESTENTRQISAVYDKILDIRKFKKEHPDYSLRIVIDECQNLVSANIFRKDAIESILKLISDNIADSYTFITATYDSMCCLEFDSITLFEDKNYKPVFQSVDVRFAEDGDFQNLVMDTALRETKPYIRLNSKDMIKKLTHNLLNEGKNCYSVTSDDKGYTTNPDGTVTYKNIIFDHITNKDDLYNKAGEADIIFATSLLDAGTNFTRYSSDSTPVFAVFNPKLMNLDEIEQAFNRFRPQKDSDGKVIQLDHAVIIQQVCALGITKVRVMQVNEQGKNIQVSSIPPKTITFTDTTSKEERNLGKISGILSVPGKYLEELETGRYNLEFVTGTNNYLIICPLYVNCSPETDKESILALGEKLFADYQHMDLSVNEDVNLLLNMFSELNASMNTNYSFLYQTGDKSTSAITICDFITPFYTLTYLLKLFLKEAKSQLSRFHNYKAADSLMRKASAPAVSSAHSNVTITLPTLTLDAPCTHINVSNAVGEHIVFINSVSNEQIHFTNINGKDLICIEDNSSSLSISIFGGRYTGNGAIAEILGKEIRIISANDRDDAEKAKCSFDKANPAPITIIDTIHHFKVVLMMSNAENIVGDLTENEHLESLLNMLKMQKPEIGEALYFTKQMQLRIDYMKLFNNAYSAFQNQYYYYPNRLMDELQKRLNVPVTCRYYQPETYKIETIEEDREKLLAILKQLYRNPLVKDILCDVLHYGKAIPRDLDNETKEQIAQILQSNLYKKEYKSLRKLSDALTFDYIIKVLGNSDSDKDTNKHIKRIEYMLINQAIIRNSTLPFSTKVMKMQFTEQSTLIDIISKRKQANGTKKFTLNDTFMDSLNQEYNKAMQAIMPSYKPKSRTQFKNMLHFVYNIINKNSKSRKPELTDPILSIDDVPFE